MSRVKYVAVLNKAGNINRLKANKAEIGAFTLTSPHAPITVTNSTVNDKPSANKLRIVVFEAVKFLIISTPTYGVSFLVKITINQESLSCAV